MKNTLIFDGFIVVGRYVLVCFAFGMPLYLIWIPIAFRYVCWTLFVNIYQGLCFWGPVFRKFDKMCIPVNVIAICVDGTYGGYRRWTGKLFSWFTAGANPLTIIGFCGL